MRNFRCAFWPVPRCPASLHPRCRRFTSSRPPGALRFGLTISRLFLPSFLPPFSCKPRVLNYLAALSCPTFQPGFAVLRPLPILNPSLDHDECLRSSTPSGRQSMVSVDLATVSSSVALNSRLWFLGTVLVFTIICLAMAGHFQSVLAASDLSESTHPMRPSCP